MTSRFLTNAGQGEGPRSGNAKNRKAYQLGGKTFHLSEEEKNILKLTLGKGGSAPMPDLKLLPTVADQRGGSVSFPFASNYSCSWHISAMILAVRMPKSILRNFEL